MRKNNNQLKHLSLQSQILLTAEGERKKRKLEKSRMSPLLFLFSFLGANYWTDGSLWQSNKGCKAKEVHSDSSYWNRTR